MNPVGMRKFNCDVSHSINTLDTKVVLMKFVRAWAFCVKNIEIK